MIKFAIIVTYEPNINILNRLCSTIISQEFNIVIFDNSELERVEIEAIEKCCNCYLISKGKNMGIAFAQNEGVKFAKSKGAEIVTFFDQDSIITDDLLYKLEKKLIELKNCVVCPVSVEENTGIEYPSHRITNLGITKDIYSKTSKEIVEVDIAISSGTTMFVDTINKTGYFDEDFFIDFVDIEWCIRSRRLGTKIYVVPDAIMYHSIGQSSLRVGPLTIIKHNPVRTYYKTRNSFLLLRKNVNYLFALRQIIPAIIHNLVLIFLVRNKKEYLRCYLKGFFHGIIGKTGKLL